MIAPITAQPVLTMSLFSHFQPRRLDRCCPTGMQGVFLGLFFTVRAIVDGLNGGTEQ